MSPTLDAAIREAASLAVAALLPLFAVAAAVAIVVGLLTAALGIRDTSLAQISRALALVLALALVVEQGAAAIVAFAEASWSSPASTAKDP